MEGWLDIGFLALNKFHGYIQIPPLTPAEILEIKEGIKDAMLPSSAIKKVRVIKILKKVSDKLDFSKLTIALGKIYGQRALALFLNKVNQKEGVKEDYQR
jgi:hypothetical protein